MNVNVRGWEGCNELYPYISALLKRFEHKNGTRLEIVDTTH